MSLLPVTPVNQSEVSVKVPRQRSRGAEIGGSQDSQLVKVLTAPYLCHSLWERKSGPREAWKAWKLGIEGG